MRFSVLADFVCGFAVLKEFFFSFAVSSIPQCPPPEIKNFPGEHAPRPPCGRHLSEPPFMKSWIRPRKYLFKMLETAFARL